MLISQSKTTHSVSPKTGVAAWREHVFPVLVVCVSAALTIMTFTAMGAALAQIA